MTVSRSDHHFSMAPLQGFTDFAFRKVFHEVIGGIENYYIPYISVGPGHAIRNSALRDILPENNQAIPVIPQILCGNRQELIFLADRLVDAGYSMLNLNLGCPYPMAVKRGRGTGLLENTPALTEILDTLFSHYSFNVSIKFRAGITDSNVILRQIQLLKKYPFQTYIFHPRTAIQLYKGTADPLLFRQLTGESRQKMVYNGDLLDRPDFIRLTKLLPDQSQWMVGRGLLKNIFLLEELSGHPSSPSYQQEKLLYFHEQLLHTYQQSLTDPGHVLNKMKEFWIYFSSHFSDQHKVLKLVKKIRNQSDYPPIILEIFRNFLII